MFIRRLRYWLGRAKREAGLRAEMELHIDEKADALRDAGWSESDARAEARRRFGNFAMKQEESREIWIARYWSDFWQDVRYGAHALIAQPGFALAAVVALVLGIAVNAMLFNVFNALALAPWAIRDAKQTVEVLTDHGPTSKGSWSGFSWPHFRYLRDHTHTLAGLVAFSRTDARLRRGDVSWNVSATTASENYFDVIGTSFAVGRGFSAASGSLHSPAPEIVLHYDTWMARFGGDARVVGEWLELSGHLLQVVGVAALGFSGPTPTKPHIWIPAGWHDIVNPGSKTIDDQSFCCISVIGRLKPGVSRAGAQAELGALSTQFRRSIKQEPRRVLLTGASFLADPSRFGRASAVFLAMGVASFLILLLACANVANLQLARAAARRREMAVRLSLGAGRGRILRQLIAESLLLSGIAGIGSVAISAWAPAWILRTLAPPEGLTFRFANDLRVLAFILVMTVVAAMLFGMAPALSALRDSTASGLRQGGPSTSTGRLRSLLLGTQVALCAILLSGTALLVRAVDRVRHADTVFHHEGVIVMSTGLDSSGMTDEQARGLLAPLMDRIGGLPRVESVAHAAVLPFGRRFNGTSVADPRTNERVSVGINEVSASFFETLRIPLVAGRAFTSSDEGRMDAAIVNQAAAERLWPGESPLGKTLALRRLTQVIGVVRNHPTGGFGSEQDPYLWIAYKGSRLTLLMVRHSGDAGPLMLALPKTARELDRRFLASVAPYSETLATWRRSADVAAAIAGVLGFLSLALACVGIYGVAAYNVSQRTREVGIRMALGARPRAVLAMFVRQNMRTVVIGAVVGTAGAIGFGRLLTALLYGVKPTDALSMTAAAALLIGTSVVATWGPARRASRVDPAITLRSE